MLLIHHMKKVFKPHFLCQLTILHFCFPLRKNLKELPILCLYFPSFHSSSCQSGFLLHQSTKTTLSKLCFAKSNCQPTSYQISQLHSSHLTIPSLKYCLHLVFRRPQSWFWFSLVISSVFAGYLSPIHEMKCPWANPCSFSILTSYMPHVYCRLSKLISTVHTSLQNSRLTYLPTYS